MVINNTTVKIILNTRDFISPEINIINSKTIATANNPILIIVVITKTIIYKLSPKKLAIFWAYTPKSMANKKVKRIIIKSFLNFIQISPPRFHSLSINIFRLSNYIYKIIHNYIK